MTQQKMLPADQDGTAGLTITIGTVIVAWASGGWFAGICVGLFLFGSIEIAKRML